MANIAEHHRAAVISSREIAYGNGTALRARPDIAQDLSLILGGTVDRFTQHSTIIIDGVRPETVAGQSTDLRAAGWAHSKIEPWTLFHRDDGRTVAVGFRDAMNAFHLGTLFDRETDPGIVAISLDRFSRASGGSWRASPATSALAAIRLSWENPQYQPLWKHPRVGPRAHAGALSWRRPLNDNESWWGYVHTFDANSAYLGSAITADLAWSELTHTGAQLFDHTLPGYWLLELDTSTLELNADPTRPPLLGKLRGTQAWVTTPYARLLQDLGDRCEVADSWTASAALRAGGGRLHPAGARILRGWGESVRDGLGRLYATGAPAHIIDAVKRVYKDAPGAMQRERGGMRIHRPDWAHTIIDLWRATLYRKALLVKSAEGVWPVRIATDSLSYADSSADPRAIGRALGMTHCEVQACGCSGRRPARGIGLGGYKHADTATTADWQARWAPKARVSRGR